MTTVQWLGCDLVTGKIVEELPGLAPQGTIGALLCAYTSASFRLPIPIGGHGAPPSGWRAAIEPGRSMIVAVLGDQPIWAGIVLPRVLGSEAMSTLACVSLEGYLDRRHVQDHAWTQQDEVAVIAAGLVADAQVEGIGFVVDAPATGVLRDRSYQFADIKTVYSGLRELSGVINGPEWTAGVQWNDNRTGFVKRLLIRPRVGYASSSPNAVFTTGSASAVVSSIGASSASYTLTEDYSSGKGANHIWAVSSGEGESRPMSTPARDEARFAAGWPRYEHIVQLSNVTDQSTLDSHAQKTLQDMAAGARVLTIEARADAYPMLGRDWHIGDDIGYELTGHGHPPQAGGRPGLTGVARAVGWELDSVRGTASPILLAPGEDVVS